MKRIGLVLLLIVLLTSCGDRQVYWSMTDIIALYILGVAVLCLTVIVIVAWIRDKLDD